MRAFDPATDYELFCLEQERLDRERRRMRVHSSDRMMKIWEEDFAERFFNMMEREATELEIHAAWIDPDFDFDQWCDEYYSNNPASE